jgi:hypothetical protein
MLIKPSIILHTTPTNRRTQLSFLFTNDDNKVFGLTSDWLAGGSVSSKVEVKWGAATIGVGEQPFPLAPESDEIGPGHCGFTFSLDRAQMISPDFGRPNDALPVCSIGAALGQKAFIVGSKSVLAGVVLPNYDEAMLEIAGKKRSVFPLLAVCSSELPLLQARYSVLNGAMLEDERGLLIGVIVAKAKNVLLIASIVDMLEVHNFKFLSEKQIADWNNPALKQKHNEEQAQLAAEAQESNARPPVPTNSLFDRILAAA